MPAIERARGRGRAHALTWEQTELAEIRIDDEMNKKNEVNKKHQRK